MGMEEWSAEIVEGFAIGAFELESAVFEFEEDVRTVPSASRSSTGFPGIGVASPSSSMTIEFSCFDSDSVMSSGA